MQPFSSRSLLVPVALFVAAVFGPATALAATGTDPMKDALAFREAQAAAVIQGKETASEAIAQIKAHPNASGLGIDPDADFSYALIDVGQRLLSAGKGADAEKLFVTAEETLDALIKRTPDANAEVKAEYLSRISLVRWQFLNKVAQAKRDIDQAILLPGSDDYLKQARENLLRSNAEFGREVKP